MIGALDKDADSAEAQRILIAHMRECGLTDYEIGEAFIGYVLARRPGTSIKIGITYPRERKVKR